MPGTEEISEYLPYLRRFARALSGSQKSGDAYVLATLETIVAEPKGFHDLGGGRTALYRMFIDIWTSTRVNDHVEETASSDNERGARRSLDAIGLRPRIAFLLSTLEEFDTHDISSILSVSTREANDLIQQAGAEIADQIRTDVLIIEDEPMIAHDLQSIVEDLGHQVIGVASTHAKAIKAVADKRPGLILSDIQLADGSSGLDAVNQILAEFEVPTIFITAYPERFLTGERPEPAFLITKPFRVDSLRALISQALFFDRRSHRFSGSPVEASAPTPKKR
jgi:CheY-like chemotaxis protein/DNA-directed RNA polymerase specialized sigma24 family protein